VAGWLGATRPSKWPQAPCQRIVAAGELQRLRIIEYTRGLVKILNRKEMEKSSCECYEVIRRIDEIERTK